MVKRKRNILSFEFKENLEELLKQYAAFMGISKSDAIRNLLTEGLYMKTKHVQFKRLEEYLAGRDPFKFRTECERCREKDNTIILYVDGNINNIKSDNVVTLCRKCLTEFELFRLKHNVKEMFIEWFFKD